MVRLRVFDGERAGRVTPFARARRGMRVLARTWAPAAMLAACLVSFVSGCDPATVEDADAASDIVISDAWVRATSSAAPVAGGYITVRNDGDSPDRLLSVRTPAAREVQLHEVRHEGGIARMRMLDQPLAIPANGTVTLAPGGMHLMLIQPARPLEEGAAVPATLQFERAGPVDVTFRVRPAGAMSPTPHAGH